MPTGYTADIAKGITFKEYALGCARAFGALIHMRDDNPDTPIPEKLPQDNYHKEALEKALKDLSDFKALSSKDLMNGFLKHKKDTRAYQKKWYTEKKELAKRYANMLTQVKKYVPPTPEHENFKKFMIEQIESSIDFDCGNYADRYKSEIIKIKNLTKAEWYDDTLKGLQWSIDYHKKELAEESARNTGRQKWVDALRDSLKEY
jgi:hypothetical protein